MRRRTLSAFVAVLFLLPVTSVPLATAAAAPAPDLVLGAGAVQIAEADWLIKEGRELWWYFGVGIRYAEPPYVEAFAAVGRARCTKIKRRNMHIIMCRGTARERPVDLDEFWVEPDLSSGHLRLEWNEKNVSEITWEAQENLEPFVYAEATAHGGFAAGGAYRWAPASGTVMGKKVVGRGGFRDFGVLAEYAGGGFFVPGRAFHLRPDGTVVARARFEVPR